MRVDIKETSEYEQLYVFTTNNGWITRAITWQHPDFQDLVDAEDDGTEPDYSGATIGDSR